MFRNRVVYILLQLFLKAHTPYEEAFVAVRNINMQGNVIRSDFIKY